MKKRGRTMKNHGEFEEFFMDAQLKINTTGRNDSLSDEHHHPYEPTEYVILNRIVESGYLRKEDYLIDYGCGKGRVPIYLNKQIGCRTLGVELMEEFYLAAQNNLASYGDNGEISFINDFAEQFQVPIEANSFFFFNPFSVDIFKGVMHRILDSYYLQPRKMKFFFYYPSDEYVGYLMGMEEMEFVDEIDCSDLPALNQSRNRVLIFTIDY